MSNIKFTKHAEEQMKIRDLSAEDVIGCLKNPDDVLYDVKERTFVAVKRLDGKLLITIYTIEGEEPKVITVFRTDKLSMVENRIRSGRWVRL